MNINITNLELMAYIISTDFLLDLFNGILHKHSNDLRDMTFIGHHIESKTFGNKIEIA